MKWIVTVSGPFSETRLVAFIEKRIKELSQKKSQREIALEAGFKNPNMLSMIKTGRSKLPRERVSALAAALEVDPARLMTLALEQDPGDADAAAIREIFPRIVTKREFGWIEAIRLGSDGSDPALSKKMRSSLMALVSNGDDGSVLVRVTPQEALILDSVRDASGGTVPDPTLAFIQALRRLVAKFRR